MRTFTLFTILLASTLSFAGIHADCHADASDTGKGNRIFAMGYMGGVIESIMDNEVNGKRVYSLPNVLSYEQTFSAVCAEIDKHPELWNGPSKDAIVSAVNALWKNKD